MSENIATTEVAEDSKIKTLAKKYWKPVAGATAAIAAVGAIVYVVAKDDSDEIEIEETYEIDVDVPEDDTK